MAGVNSELTEADKRAFQCFLAAYRRVMTALGREMAQHTELSIEQYDALLHLEYAPDHRLRLSDLADRVLLSRSGLSRLIDRMEAKGWVRREECEEDRRGAFAVLTDAGREAREDSWPVLQAAMRRHFKSQINDPAEIEIWGRVNRDLAFGPEEQALPWEGVGEPESDP
ncbi:MAG: MarR family winged helix-turn-helix transcriptional regulator [Fimbriimonadaceae bacterium]|nr:MarR family winged helix-turn-helix transcriptional regulator [Fimbriimonadaceae bacterium]